MGGNSVQRVDDKKPPCSPAGDLPDASLSFAALWTDEEVASYGAAGTFIKLQDYITPEIMQILPDIWKSIRIGKTAIHWLPDGNIYSCPPLIATAYTADSIPYVNKDWAAQVHGSGPLTQPMDLETL